MDDWALQSATALVAGIKSKKFTSRELLEAYLARIARHNGAINAVVTHGADRAQSQADALDAALARGEIKGPLHGLPITIKDTFETVGLVTTAGAEMYRDHVGTTNADAVQRLIAAGAVIIGKTNVPYLAGDVQSFNKLFGTTNNPWDITRTPGGSSGGAAAAVAAGMTAFELGSDIGGSIRTPAHFCGIYGHKPSYGLISSRGHVPGPPGTRAQADLGVMGPLARSAEDLQLLLNILAGPTPQESVAWQLHLPPPRHTSIANYRVALWLDDPAFPIDDSMKSVLLRAADDLNKHGVKIDRHARPAIVLADAYRCYLSLLLPLLMAGMSDNSFAQFVKGADSFSLGDTSLDSMIHRFGAARHRDWLKANEARARYRLAMQAFFQDYDVLLMPVTPTLAFPHDQSPDMFKRVLHVNGEARPYHDNFSWISLATLTYLPATVAPVGFANGLPIGMQIVGPYLEDHTTIKFASLMENLLGGFKPPPLN